jgi:hypothetical protein
MRTLAGVLTRDLPRYLRLAVREPQSGYLLVCNRQERLELGPGGEGVRCNWRWGTDLHAPRYLPALGRWLLRSALRDHPVRHRCAPLDASADEPEVSFIIGHRGQERLPLLLATIGSIAAQEGVRVECIVVQQEQDDGALANSLPPWVRHVQTPPQDDALPFCRSWAFNVGSAHARAPVLVLHDNDMLVPVDYGAQLLARVAQGWEAMNLKRFVFYLDADHSRGWIGSESPVLDRAPQDITQNLEGGSVAITREAFERIGGMDESFVGWGGEDNEFWERASTLRAWQWGYLPMVHLWHGPQRGKHDPANPGAQRYRTLAALAPRDRIAALRGRARGLREAPVIPAGDI